jgi:hypothetical protein
MTIAQPFSPRQGGNKNFSATTTSQIVTIGKGEKQVRVTCAAGGGNLHVYHYNSANTSAVRAADTSDYCVMAGQTSTITKPDSHDTLAVVADAGTAAGKAIPGEGW